MTWVLHIPPGSPRPSRRHSNLSDASGATFRSGGFDKRGRGRLSLVSTIWLLRGVQFGSRVMRTAPREEEREKRKRRAKQSNAMQTRPSKAGIGRTSVESPPLATERSLERAGYVSVDACAPRPASTTLTFNASGGAFVHIHGAHVQGWYVHTYIHTYRAYIAALPVYLAHTTYITVCVASCMGAC